MKKINTAAAAIVLSALSFGALAAENSTIPASQSNTNITNIEAGSNMVTLPHASKGNNDAAFNAHTLVAGEWE